MCGTAGLLLLLVHVLESLDAEAFGGLAVLAALALRLAFGLRLRLTFCLLLRLGQGLAFGLGLRLGFVGLAGLAIHSLIHLLRRLRRHVAMADSLPNKKKPCCVA